MPEPSEQQIDAEIEAAAPSIPVFDLRIEQEDLDAVEATLRSGWWTMGPRVEEFEERFAEHLGRRHVIATSSCTTALHLALLGAGVGPGDEVIVPSFTFVATVATVIQAGATPVFAEIGGQDNLCMDPEHAESLITPRTKAIMPVHYGGYAASPERFEGALRGARAGPARGLRPRSLLDRRRAVRSAPSASPAPSASSPTRCWGSARAALSAPTTTSSPAQARLLRSQGMTAGRWSATRGAPMATTYRPRLQLPDGRAAGGAADLPLRPAAGEIERRRELTRLYRERLAGVDGVSVPFADEQVAPSSAYSMSVMLTDPANRDTSSGHNGEKCRPVPRANG